MIRRELPQIEGGGGLRSPVAICDSVGLCSRLPLMLPEYAVSGTSVLRGISLIALMRQISLHNGAFCASNVTRLGWLPNSRGSNGVASLGARSAGAAVVGEEGLGETRESWISGRHRSEG